MATLHTIETDLFFALRPEAGQSKKWWKFADANSDAEYLLESRQTESNRLEATLTGGGHVLVNVFRVEQIDHPPRPQEFWPWQYTWISTRRDNQTFTWGNGLVIPAIWEPDRHGTRVSAMSNETNPATGRRVTMTIDYVASGTPGTLDAMMTLRQRVSDDVAGDFIKFDKIRFSPGGLNHVTGQIFGVFYVLALKATG